jgi:predicted transcriptional regulator
MRTTENKKAPVKEKKVILSPKTLMLRLKDQHTLQSLEYLQKEFRESQSSKAIVKAVNMYQRIKSDLSKVETELYELRDKYNALVEACQDRATANADLEIAERKIYVLTKES